MFSYGCYLNSFLTADAKFYEFIFPQFVRGLTLMFCFLPTNNIALGSMSKDKVGKASGLYNLTRNLGGEVGIAIINTILSDKTKVFNQYINENITSTSISALMRIDSFRQLLDGKVIDPEKTTYFLLVANVNKQVFVIAINNIFSSIGLLFFIVMLLLPFTANINNKNDEMHAH